MQLVHDACLTACFHHKETLGTEQNTLLLYSAYMRNRMHWMYRWYRNQSQWTIDVINICLAGRWIDVDTERFRCGLNGKKNLSKLLAFFLFNWCTFSFRGVMFWKEHLLLLTFNDWNGFTVFLYLFGFAGFGHTNCFV